MSRLKQREIDRRRLTARASGRAARARSVLMERALHLANVAEPGVPFEKLPPEIRRGFITAARETLNRRERRDGGERRHKHGLGAMASPIKSKSAK